MPRREYYDFTDELPNVGQSVIVGIKKPVEWFFRDWMPYKRKDGEMSKVLFWTSQGKYVGTSAARFNSITKPYLSDAAVEFIIAEVKARDD